MTVAIELKTVSSETENSYYFPGEIFTSAVNSTLSVRLESQNLSWLKGNKMTLPPSVFQGKYVTEARF